MKKYAVIVAAGSGSRMGNEVPKQFLLLAGKPILLYSIETFISCFADINIILVVPAPLVAEATRIVSHLSTIHPFNIVPGAQSRFASVKAGLEKTSDESIIFVHDGVRCLLTEELILRCYELALEK